MLVREDNSASEDGVSQPTVGALDICRSATGVSWQDYRVYAGGGVVCPPRAVSRVFLVIPPGDKRADINPKNIILVWILKIGSDLMM